jgi:hypothetical protein
LEQVLRVQQMKAQQTSWKVESGIDAEVPMQASLDHGQPIPTTEFSARL